MNILLVVIIFFIPTSAIAIDFHWIMPDGSVAPDVKNRKANSNFGGLLLVTADIDWEKKWNEMKSPPKFKDDKIVKRGEHIYILPFFANPKLDNDSNFRVICDVRLTRPDGSVSIDRKEVHCGEGKLEVSPQQIFVARAAFKYVGEQNDPLGEWKVSYRIKDILRGASILLEDSFVLVEK